ncbi:MAG: nucleoid-associated protein, YbaB/EbfC family [Deltaproteobacteria bacterium RIFCSPHIGHO2_12_FULL_43_9]|nr:MAG: nucleoid-associated protein, YbaB/EbfC family [Deltaproteobacteria bacterium RIFCSPHIGHO2_12_FULL_43_9]
MQQAKEAQSKLQQLQEELAGRTVEASSGGGMVKVIVNGRQEIVSLEIEDEIIKGGDKGMMQNLILSAVNQGIKRSQELVAAELGKVTGGLPFPGLLGG